MSASYSAAETSVPRTGQYWDPAGEYEFHNTVYTLTVFVPPRPPPRYLPAFLTRPGLDVSPYHIIRSARTMPDYTHFERRDLSDMRTKTIKVKAYRFPLELRCKHVAEKKVCEVGCYVLEKGGEEVSRFMCGKDNCEGHVYCGNVKEDEEGAKCFGKKSERLVCIEELP